MVGPADDVSFSMVPELMSWAQFPPATQFFTARIPPSLASVGLVATVASDREQAAPTTTAHT
jgi:hypothetical protein